MIAEFQRSNALILKLAEQQDDLGLEKESIERELMDKLEDGVQDVELFNKLKDVRLQIDSVYDEKLMLVQKMYNLTQKFVQELDAQNMEQLKHIQQ